MNNVSSELVDNDLHVFYDVTNRTTVMPDFEDKCLESASMTMSEKLERSDLVILGKHHSKGWVRAKKVFKGREAIDLNDLIPYTESVVRPDCRLSPDDFSSKMIFFLSKATIDDDNSSKLSPSSSSSYSPLFRPLASSASTKQVISSLINDDGRQEPNLGKRFSHLDFSEKGVGKPFSFNRNGVTPSGLLVRGIRVLITRLDLS